jgi:2-oxoglutarate dehydrogenase complex dehydrogenase (E1) component-like enzyme
MISDKPQSGAFLISVERKKNAEVAGRWHELCNRQGGSTTSMRKAK